MWGLRPWSRYSTGQLSRSHWPQQKVGGRSRKDGTSFERRELADDIIQQLLMHQGPWRTEMIPAWISKIILKIFILGPHHPGNIGKPDIDVLVSLSREMGM
ncbi:hypothetical protein SCARD494_10243 [Seiridium cardinale]